MTALVPPPPERSVRVDLEAIRQNIRGFVDHVSPAVVMSVVKADAYGHGAAQVAQAALEGGASWLGVAHIEEALALRAASIDAPVLAWLHTPRSDFQAAVAESVRIGVSARSELRRIVGAAEATGRPAVVHLKLDSGLGRNGAMPDEWQHLVIDAATYQAQGIIDVEGVMSHLSVAEDATRAAETNRQRDLFDSAVDAARAAGLNVRFAHVANTAAALRRSDLHYDMVRVGIGTYGLSPLGPGELSTVSLVRALTLRTVLSSVKTLPADHGVSYGARHVTSRSTRVGLVPVGYGDGIPRSARGMSVLIDGRAFPILGVIAMDQMVVDLGAAHDHDVRAPQAGDEVIVIGTEEGTTVDDWATAAGLINYEIVTRLTSRPARIYV